MPMLLAMTGLNVLLKTSTSPAIRALQNELPTSERREGEEMGRTMSIGAASPVVVLPCCICE